MNLNYTCEDAVGVLTPVCFVCAQANGVAEKLDVGGLWSTYQSGRIVRAASIHGMAREYSQD